MKNQETKIKYFVYCRKSTDTEDRQVQSIERQKDDVEIIIENNNLEIVDLLEESRSAKIPNNRPIFNSMLAKIEKGEANGIITYNANRLSRNSIDSGYLIHLMDLGKLLEIRTLDQIFRNTPNDKFLLSLSCGQAKLENDNKGEVVKSGLRRRYKMGYPNGVAPIGFLNDKTAEPGNRGWIIDKHRFPIVKKIRQLCGSNQYSIRGLLKIVNEDLKLKTPLRKRQGGKKLVLSYLIGMLKSPVYAGFFYDKDEERHELNKKVPRMETEEEYWKIQKILGKRGNPREGKIKNIFIYHEKERAKCGSCGGRVVGENKFQMICSDCKKKFALAKKRDYCPNCKILIEKMKNPKYLHYIYYHCTKRKNPGCTEKSIEEKKVDEKVISHFENHLQISPDLRDWCIENLKQLDEDIEKKISTKQKSLKESMEEKEREYDQVLRKTITATNEEAEDLKRLRELIRSEIDELEEELANLQKNAPEGIKKAEKAYNLAAEIVNIFKDGTKEEKIEALEETGSNLTLKDKKVEILSQNHFALIIDGLSRAKEQNKAFEPAKIRGLNEQNEAFASVRTTLLRG